MSEPFIAEIKMFAGNFAPRQYAFCDGQLVSIAQNTALFSLVGTIYGGDGRTNFGLPDLRGRSPMHWGNGPGLTTRYIGQKFGNEAITVTEAQMPAHAHTTRCNENSGNTQDPEGNFLSRDAGGTTATYHTGSTNTMAADTVTDAGGGQGHKNMQPVQCVSFIIALVGLYPSRN